MCYTNRCRSNLLFSNFIVCKLGWPSYTRVTKTWPNVCPNSNECRFPLRLSPSSYPYYSTQNACRSADRWQIPLIGVKLQTNFELGNNQCIYCNMAVKNNNQNTFSLRVRAHTVTHNKVTLSLHTLAIHTSKDKEAPTS